jgi:hypothetical protein
MSESEIPRYAAVTEDNYVAICKALGIDMDVDGKEILAQVLADKQARSEALVHIGMLNNQLALTGCINPNYASLAGILMRALDQASAGKGKERHSYGEPFEQQKICQINRWLQSPDGDLYQAVKKIIEAKRLPHDRGVAELLGAINYVAAAIIIMDELNASAAKALTETPIKPVVGTAVAVEVHPSRRVTGATGPTGPT